MMFPRSLQVKSESEAFQHSQTDNAPSKKQNPNQQKQSTTPQTSDGPSCRGKQLQPCHWTRHGLLTTCGHRSYDASTTIIKALTPFWVEGRRQNAAFKHVNYCKHSITCKTNNAHQCHHARTQALLLLKKKQCVMCAPWFCGQCRLAAATKGGTSQIKFSF